MRDPRRIVRAGYDRMAPAYLAADLDPDSWLGTPMFWSHFDAGTNLALLRDAGLDVILDRLVPDPLGHGEHLFALVERRRAA